MEKKMNWEWNTNECYLVDAKNKLLRFLYTGADKLKKISLPGNNVILNCIGEKAFNGNSTIEKIILPNNITVIEHSAFEKCDKLQLVEYCTEVNSQKKEASAASDVTIQHRAFKNCESLHTVILPEIPDDKKLIIESEAFYGCKALRTVVMTGGGAFDISPDAFEMCDSDLLTFVVSAGSSAERFAREKGYRYVAV